MAVTVCASIQQPPSLARIIKVNLTSVDGMAIGRNLHADNNMIRRLHSVELSLFTTAQEDYNAVATTLTFATDTHKNCVNFTIYEDGIVELDENFSVILSSQDDVRLDPDVTVVTINGIK